MKGTALLRLSRVLLLVAIVPAASVAQNEQRVRACAEGTDFESERYRIVHAKVEDPFRFLYWKNTGPRFRAVLENQLFTSERKSEALLIIEKARLAPVGDRNFVFRYERVDVENCDPAAKTLDLVYRIYTTDPPRFSGGAWESQTTAETSPQAAAGLTQSGPPLHFTPVAGYDRSDGLFGGGRMEIAPFKGKFLSFDTFSASGRASDSMHSLSLALRGFADYVAWLQHAEWRINYTNDTAPAAASRLETAGLSAQMQAETRPFWHENLLARFGSLVQGGNMRSDFAASLLPPQTAASAGYGSLKSYLGLSSRTTHNVFSASYGLELGSVGPSTHVDWRKHIGDVVDEFWIPLADHKPLELEARSTFGGIQVPHTIPLPARFFGGDSEQFFIPGDSWQIRDEPFIRAIPDNRFYLTAQGAGADTFASVNLTLSYPIKTRPIVPKELSTDPDFKKTLRGQIVSATSAQQNYYTWKDPHFAAALRHLPNLKQLLSGLRNAVIASQLPDPFNACSDNIALAEFDVTNTLEAKGVAQYGDLSALLPVDSDDLQSVHDACVQLNDPGVAVAVTAVDAARTAILNDFNAIDQKSAARKAAKDMAFVSRTLNTLFNELNIFSVSPVAVFDTAWIGPAKGAFGGNRIGPGGGMRLELASSVNFTLGYAWNVDRQPGEGKGALFFSVGIRDLFH